MKLTFKRREVSDLQHLRTLVSDNLEAMEPGLKILGSNLNLGRTNVELVALDARNGPILFVLGLTADDAMLVRALEAYAWCLEYPESVQRLVQANTQLAWPPRIAFVAERLLEAFVRKMRLLNFSSVDCFEFRYVEANGTTGFYLDRVDWAAAPTAGEPAPPRAERPARVEPPVVEVPAAPPEEPHVAPREEPKLVLLREEPREEERDPPEEPIAEPDEPVRAEGREPPRPEPKVTPREEPMVAPRVPVEEPRIVMMHEPKPAPRIEPKPTRIAEPAPTNGSSNGDSVRRAERPPALLKGLRAPAETPPRRRPREVPELPRPSAEPKPASPREVARPPAPAAPAASPSSPVEPKAPAASTRVAHQGAEPRAPRSDAKGGDLAPTWRKFLDRLTSTFDTRTGSPPMPPRAGAPAPAPVTESAPSPLAVQPFAADIEVSASEVAPDEVIDESQPSPELTDSQRKVMQGLTLPENGELAPQWKKFLDRPTLDETKIDVVRRYLQREFPLCTVYDFFEFQRNAQVFQLQDNHGKVTQLITMTAEFFDGHRDLEIRAWIEKHRLAQAMRQAGQAGVIVSQAGLQIEKR